MKRKMKKKTAREKERKIVKIIITPQDKREIMDENKETHQQMGGNHKNRQKKLEQTRENELSLKEKVILFSWFCYYYISKAKINRSPTKYHNFVVVFFFWQKWKFNHCRQCCTHNILRTR